MRAAQRHPGKRRGSVYAMVILAMLVLVGMAAFSMDIGRTILAAQRAQEVADAEVLAATCQPMIGATAQAIARMGDTVAANNQARGPAVTYTSSDIVFYTVGQYVAGYGTLGPYEEAVKLTTRVNVPYYFSKMFGLNGTTVARRATAVRTFALGSPIAPMWISWETQYLFGQQQELLMADGPHYANIPGNFGWLEPLTGSNDFLTLLCGYNCPPAMITGNYVTIGQTVYAYTGVSVGQWKAALLKSNDGTARLQRASQPPYDTDTFENYHKDNPRIIIVPMVQYLGGTGSNAAFLIKRFGAFWLESVDAGAGKSIIGRFIKFQTSTGAWGDPLAEEAGLWTAKLVK